MLSHQPQFIAEHPTLLPRSPPFRPSGGHGDSCKVLWTATAHLIFPSTRSLNFCFLFFNKLTECSSSKCWWGTELGPFSLKSSGLYSPSRFSREMSGEMVVARPVKSETLIGHLWGLDSCMLMRWSDLKWVHAREKCLDTTVVWRAYL